MRKFILFGSALVFIFVGTFSAAGQTCEMDATIGSSGVDIPDRIVPARKYNVRVSVENSGTCAWETSSRVRLSIKIVRGPSGSSMQRDELTPIVELKQKVPPGKSNVFYYEIEGPYYLGNYTLEWIMTVNNKPFGSEARRTIEVAAPR